MPYNKNNYPAQIKNLPAGARTIWINTFNAVYESSKSETKARQAAWNNVKNKYKKVNGKWIKKDFDNNFINNNDGVKMKIKKSNTIEITSLADGATDGDIGLFKSFIPLIKQNDSFVISKANDDSESKNFFFLGEASNTNVDKGDDRMSKNFIKSMKTQLIGLNVFAEHEHDIEKTLGYVSDVSGNENNVIVETALENPDENNLVEKILKKAAHGTKFFYSVLGRITKASKKMDSTLNKMVREIEDGEIYEVSITALPEGNVSFAQPIMKSFKNFMKSYETEDEINSDTADIEDDGNDDYDDNDIVKALQEMVDSDEVKEQLYNLFYAFRSAIYDITHNEALKPSEKKEKIMSLAVEYSTQVETLSTELATLVEKINEDLGIATE